MSQLALLRGTLDMFILKAISTRPMHGYAISQAIREATEDVLVVEEGSLYPALHRIEKRGWIEGEWIRNETGHRARQYRLTQDGRKELETKLRRWSRFQDAAARVLAMPKPSTG